MLNFDMNDLMSAVELMGSGMLGIFAVMAVIALIVYGLTRIGSKK